MKYIYLTIVLMIFGSCGNPGNNQQLINIPISYDLSNVLPFSESDYDYDITIIPLENNQDAYLMFEQLRLEVYKDFFFIMTLGKGVKVFYKNGDYLTSLNKGRGPGELVFASDISFDKQTEKLEVLDANSIKIYDLAGNFEEELPCSNKYIEFVKFGGKRIFYDSNKDRSQEYNFIIMFENGDYGYFEEKYGPTLKPTYSPRHFNVYGNTLYLCSNYSNDIYKMGIKDNTPAEFAYVESMNDNKNIKGIDLEEYDELCNRNEWFRNITGFYQVNENLFGLCIGKDRVRSYLYDKTGNKIFDHPFKNLPVLFQPKFIDESGEYFLFPPEFFNERTMNIFQENNPMLYSKMMEQKGEGGSVDKMENLYVIRLVYSKK